MTRVTVDVSLAARVMGEAGICGLPALLAAAWVCSRAVCYGNAAPSPAASWVAANFRWLPDPSAGAVHMFSTADLARPAVRALTRNKSPSLVLPCAGGLRLWFYR